MVVLGEGGMVGRKGRKSLPRGVGTGPWEPGSPGRDWLSSDCRGAGEGLPGLAPSEEKERVWPWWPRDWLERGWGGGTGYGEA